MTTTTRFDGGSISIDPPCPMGDTVYPDPTARVQFDDGRRIAIWRERFGTYLSRAECIAEALATATYRFAWVDATHARLTATDGGSVVLPIGLALQAAPQQVVTALAVIDRTSGEWNLRGTITLLDKSGSCVARVDAGKVESWRR